MMMIDVFKMGQQLHEILIKLKEACKEFQILNHLYITGME